MSLFEVLLTVDAEELQVDLFRRKDEEQRLNKCRDGDDEDFLTFDKLLRRPTTEEEWRAAEPSCFGELLEDMFRKEVCNALHLMRSAPSEMRKIITCTMLFNWCVQRLPCIHVFAYCSFGSFSRTA